MVRAVVVLAAAFLATACSQPPAVFSGPEPLNTGLDYFGWKESVEQESGGAPRSTGIEVRPGMKVVLDVVPMEARGQEYAIRAPSRYEWIRPAPGDYSSGDWFFLSYLLSMGQFDRLPAGSAGDDAWAVYRSLGQELADDPASDPARFSELYAEAVMEPLASMKLEVVRNAPIQAAPATAGWVREWLTRPGREDFRRPAPKKPSLQLVSTFRDSELRIGGWNIPFFLDDDGATPSALAEYNRWFDKGQEPLSPRGFPSLLVAVRVEGDSVSQFVPLYYSLRDVERRLGARVTGFRRSRALLPELPPAPDGGESPPPADFLADDGYFTVWFDERGKSYGEKQAVVVDSNLKAALLVGHGDVIVTGERLAATDSPGHR